MSLALDQLPDDVAALQAIIDNQAAELEAAMSQLKARDVVIRQLQLNLDKLKRSPFGRSSGKVRLYSIRPPVPEKGRPTPTE